MTPAAIPTIMGILEGAATVEVGAIAAAEGVEEEVVAGAAITAAELDA